MMTAHQLYEMLHQEQRDVVLIIARQTARDDLRVEEALQQFGPCPCRRHWDGMLCQVADVLPNYLRPAQPSDERVVQGRVFRVRLPVMEEVAP